MWQKAERQKNAKALACRLPAYAKIMRVNRRNDVEQSGNNDEFGSIIRSCKLHSPMSQIHNSTQDVEQSTPKIASKAQHFQHIARIRLIQLALHHDAKCEHAGDGDKEQHSANPMSGQHMTETGDEPAKNKRNIRQ